MEVTGSSPTGDDMKRENRRPPSVRRPPQAICLAAPFRARTLVRSLATCALVLVAAWPGIVAAGSTQEMRSLDEQVQEIKSEVLSIAAELDRLEEKLLYPSNTQLAVFVALEEGQDVEIDSVQIQIDGAPVAHHIYTFKELEALQKGGVQRIYTGNVATGAHRIDVAVAGRKSGGAEFGASQSFSFEKEVEPKLVEITVQGGGLGDGGIQIEEW